MPLSMSYRRSRRVCTGARMSVWQIGMTPTTPCGPWQSCGTSGSVGDEAITPSCEPGRHSLTSTNDKKIRRCERRSVLPRAKEQLPAPRREPELTLKQETFVNALLETGNQYEAYCRAYECKNMSRGAIDVEASKLARHPKIALRLGQFRQSKTAVARARGDAHLAGVGELDGVAHEVEQHLREALFVA